MNQQVEKALADCYLDHVAIAVKNLDESEKIYRALGFEFDDEREIVESQGVETAFAKVDQRAKIELLCPYGEKGPIHSFIEKKGTGIHHLCFRVSDIKKKSRELREQGFKLIYDGPQVGAGNCLVNFIHPKSSGGVLIEISEKLDERRG